MEDLLSIYFNLSLSLHWAWLGEHIVTNKPFAVRVLCKDWCPIDALLPIFASAEEPWSMHDNFQTLPPGNKWEVVLIISDSKERTQKVLSNINSKGQSQSSYSNYLVVQINDVAEPDLQTIFQNAWKWRLTQIIVVRLHDRAIYAAYEKCQQPQIIKMSTLKWADFKMLDADDCPLQFYNLNDLYISEMDLNKGELNERVSHWFQLWKYYERGLHFRDGWEDDVGGDYTLDFPLTKYENPDFPSLVFSDVVWCVPDTCTFRDTSYLLWEEFPLPVWLCIASSVLVVSIVVYLVALPRLSFGDSTIRIIGTVASVGVPLPGGHARWPLAGWLLSTIIFGTLYQTMLNSIMTAPPCGRVEYESQLLESDLKRFCMINAVRILHGDPESESYLRFIDSLIDKCEMQEELNTFTYEQNHTVLKKIAVLTTRFQCGYFKRDGHMMTEIPASNTYKALYGFPKLKGLSDRWTSAFRRLTLYAEAAGFIELWQRPSQGGKHKWFKSPNLAVKPIALNQLKPAFFLLARGSALGAIVFVGEVLWALWRN